ncbi:MAG TPA: hypothetical protein VFC89_03900, partial [Oscillospiraceae bacterium]|nr:hypothetical protein [Oscillospiraceae bacterium]
MQREIFVYPFGLVTNYSQATVEADEDIDKVINIHREMVDDWLSLNLSEKSNESMAFYMNPHIRLVYLDGYGNKLLTRTYYVFSLQHRQALEEITGIDLLDPMEERK